MSLDSSHTSDDMRAVLTLQKRSRESYAIREFASLRIPQGWVKAIVPPRGNPWVRMISFAIDPVSCEPAITVTDLQRAPGGRYHYILQEQITSGQMSPPAFSMELGRVTLGAVPVKYLDIEDVARAALDNPALATLRK